MAYASNKSKILNSLRTSKRAQSARTIASRQNTTTDSVYAVISLLRKEGYAITSRVSTYTGLNVYSLAV